MENVTFCNSTGRHGELNCSPGERLQASLAMAEGFLPGETLRVRRHGELNLAWRKVSGLSPWRAKSRLASDAGLSLWRAMSRLAERCQNRLRDYELFHPKSHFSSC